MTSTSRGFEILNLGCGDDYRTHAWNVDINRDVEPDQVIDLSRTPWPWPDNSYSLVVARHVLEHLEPVPWDELVRVLRPKGKLELAYPIGHTRFEDPTHRQYWNYNTAAALAGERKHDHEHIQDLRVINRTVNVTISGRLSRWYTRLRLWRDGAGPWLSQVPGLYGEVIATYEYHGGTT